MCLWVHCGPQHNVKVTYVWPHHELDEVAGVDLHEKRQWSTCTLKEHNGVVVNLANISTTSITTLVKLLKDG